MINTQKLAGFNELIDECQHLDEALAATRWLNKAYRLSERLENIPDVRGVILQLHQQKELLRSLRTKRVPDTLENIQKAERLLDELFQVVQNLG